MKVAIFGAFGQDGKILVGLHCLDGEILAAGRDRIELRSKGKLKKVWSIGYNEQSLQEIIAILIQFKPEIVYYMAAVHGPSTSGKLDDRNLTRERDFVDKVGLRAIVETLLATGDQIAFFYPGSSKMYAGQVGQVDARSTFSADTDYAHSKVRAFSYLESIKSKTLCIVTAVLFHHHSALRGQEFALSKITSNLARAKCGALGYIRDWSAAEDFSDAHEMMRAVSNLLIHRAPGRYVFGSGVPRTLDELRLVLEMRGDLTAHLDQFRAQLKTVWVSKAEGATNCILVKDVIFESLRSHLESNNH